MFTLARLVQLLHLKARVIVLYAPINGLPQDGVRGNPREIWHFQVFKCQFPRPWVSIVSQIPTPGDHTDLHSKLNEMIGTRNKFIAAASRDNTDLNKQRLNKILSKQSKLYFL